MITFLLLPLLLAVRVSVDVDSWRHGPEYTYRTEMRMLAVDEDNAERNRSYEIFSELKCRAPAPNALNCHFESNPRDESASLDTVSDFDVSQLPFQLNFDRLGIRDLLVSNSLRPWEVDMVRAIVNQLNVGFDARNARDGDTIPEISHLGQSRCRILISRAPDHDKARWKNEGYEIVSVGGFAKQPGEIVDIEKTRIVDDSTQLRNYFLGSKEAYRDPPHNLITKIKSSVSRLVISDTDFTSSTANEIVVSRDGKKNVTLYERITLKLVSINAAKSQLSPIPDASKASFFVHQFVGEDFSEEN